MTKRLFARLAWTGIGSPLLMLLAFEMNGTRLEWIAAPLYAPGLLIAPMISRLGGQAGNIETDLQIAFGLNFVFIWIELVEDRIARYRLKAAQ